MTALVYLSRYCIQEYAQLLATLNCDSSSKDQTFKLVPIKNNSDVGGQNHFYWKNKENKCIIPGKVNHEGKEKDSLKVKKMNILIIDIIWIRKSFNGLI